MSRLVATALILFLCACDGPPCDVPSVFMTYPPGDIPNEPEKDLRCGHQQNRTPPMGYAAVKGWAWCVCDPRLPSKPGVVEVDLLELFVWQGNVPTSVDRAEYASRADVDGYTFPYFSDESTRKDLHSVELLSLWRVKDGRFSFDACAPAFGGEVIHWWPTTYPRPAVDATTSGITARMHVAIDGPAICGVGADWWTGPTSGPNEGAMASPWVRDTNLQSIEIAWGLNAPTR